MKIEQGMGFEFLLLIATLFEAVCSVIICSVVSWQLTLILLCLMPFVIGALSVFSKVCITILINATYPIFATGHC
jgi:ABC-type multidrug transport system fused ATPase/permease subunit